MIDVGNQVITIDHKKQDCSSKMKESSVSSVRTENNHRTPVKLSFNNKEDGKSFTVTLIGKQEILLTNNISQHNLETEDRKQSPIVSDICHSLPENCNNFPSKKQSRSTPPSRHSSPKKSLSRSKVSNRREKQPASNLKHYYKSQYPQMSIDSSTESSQFNSTSENTKTNNKLYRFQAVAARRIVTTTSTAGGNRKQQGISDASTSYTSPLLLIFTSYNRSFDLGCALLNNISFF